MNRRTSMFRLPLVVAAFAAMLLAACSPSLDWRETKSADGKFSAVFPGKPSVSTREIPFGAARIPMTMTSAGKGPTLFGVGVARLPADAIATPEATEATVTKFRDALLLNSGTTVFSMDASVPQLPAETKAAARGLISVRAQRHPAAEAKKDGIAQLAAQFFVVDDRLYQVAALGGTELTANDLETFFSAFKLTQ